MTVRYITREESKAWRKERQSQLPVRFDWTNVYKFIMSLEGQGLLSSVGYRYCKEMQTKMRGNEIALLRIHGSYYIKVYGWFWFTNAKATGIDLLLHQHGLDSWDAVRYGFMPAAQSYCEWKNAALGDAPRTVDIEIYFPRISFLLPNGYITGAEYGAREGCFSFQFKPKISKPAWEE